MSDAHRSQATHDPLDTLAHGARQILDRALTARERAMFVKYLTLLVKWQKSQRLIGSSAPGWIVEHLFLDSLLFLRILPQRPRTVLDLGSGAGVPGIPIKIVMPEVELVLVESRRRRASFLSSAVRELGLEGARVMEGRAEEFAGAFAGRFDTAVMRCAGGVAALFPLAAEFVAPGGMVVASGPPQPKPLVWGEWVSVPSWKTGRTRRFAVYSRA